MKISGILEIKDLLEYSGDGFFVSDAKGRLLYCNNAANSLVGINMPKYKSLETLLKKNLIDRSTAMEAVKIKSTVIGEVKSAIGKKVTATSLPVYDFKGNLDVVICTIRDFWSYYQDKKYNHFLDQVDNIDFRNAYKVVHIKGENYCYELAMNSRVMEGIFDLTVNLGKVESTVLIYGETGVGKELIAGLIHDRSSRNKVGPFIKINCASMPVNLFETELFGYEPGSFTGALQKGKKGYFELADKGTLFLDEIGELPLEVQPKLLNVLQDKQIFRVGGTEAKPTDVRIIAATNRNLKNMVEEGKFREDLYFRLNVVPLEIPPLRERKTEIPMFIHYFLHKYQKMYGFKNREISPEVIKNLVWYPWPGNVRELANLVERLLIMSKERVIKLSDIPAQYLRYPESGNRFTVHDIAPLKEMVKEFEATVISKAMGQSKNQKEAAEMLGISFSSLSRKLRE